jgi:putative inorganic carbon (HCO3(-)) transporter
MWPAWFKEESCLPFDRLRPEIGMPEQPAIGLSALAATGVIELDHRKERQDRRDDESQKERRDVLAFWAVVLFAVLMYLAPADWIDELKDTRLVLITFIVAAGLMFLRRLIKFEPVFLDGWRGGALLAFTGLAFASISWSVYPTKTEDSSIELLKHAAIYLTMINVVTTPRRLTILCAVVVLASLAPSIGAILWYRAGENLVEGFRTRWVGTYGDPNYLAMDVGMAIPLAMTFAIRRSWSKTFRIVCALVAVLAVITIVLSHSRGGFLGLCTAMGVWAFREKRRLQAVFVGMAFVVGLLVFAPATYWQRNETIREFRGEPSAEGRIHAWVAASRMNKANPLLGVGAGAFTYAWPLYATPEAPKLPKVAHNVFMDIIAELGFVGLILFLIFVGGAVGGGFAAANSPRIGWLASAIGTSVTGFLVCMLFLSGYVAESHLYVLVGLAACAERIARADSLAPVTHPRPEYQQSQESVGALAS